MKLYFTNFEIYHNISIYLFYFIFLERPRSPWEVHAEHRLGTSAIYQHLNDVPCQGLCVEFWNHLTWHWQVSLFLNRLSREPTWNTPLRPSSLLTNDSLFVTNKRMFVSSFSLLDTTWTWRSVVWQATGRSSAASRVRQLRAHSHYVTPTPPFYGPGWLSRYSDSLRAGWSGDPIPVGGGRFSARPDRPWSPPSLLYSGYRVFPGGKASGMWLYHPPHLAPRLKKELSYSSTPRLWIHGLFWGELYLYLYFSHRILIHALIT